MYSISQNILNLLNTENTEHMKFKACLYDIVSKKQHNIETHKKISSTMLNFAHNL